MNISRKTTFAAGAVMALVLGSGTAYASTAGIFHLGATNRSHTMSVLKNSNGPALMLRSKEKTPPFRVNRAIKVPRLNADRLDGRHASSFALTAGAFGTVLATGVGMVDADNNGVPEQISAVATCPAGTRLTGGGASDFTEAGVTWFSAPVPGSSWQVAVTTDNIAGTELDVSAFAICYNPRGAVPSARVATTRADVLEHLSPALRQKLFAKTTLR